MFLIYIKVIFIHLLLIIQSNWNPLANIVSDDRVVTMKNRKFELDFNLPFTDIGFSNSKFVKIFETNNVVFMIHGQNLYYLNLTRLEKELKFIQKLDSNIEQEVVLDVQAIVYNDHLILLIIYNDYIEVYQLENKWETLSKSSLKIPSNSTSLQSVQQLTIHGTFKKAQLFKNNSNRLFLIMALKFSKLHGQLSIFEWTNSFFHRSLESTHQSINSLKVVKGTGSESQNIYIITVKYHQSKVFVDVFKLKISSQLELKSKQNLVLPSTHAYPFTFKGRNNLLLCQKQLVNTKSSSRQTCRLFTMIDGKFIEYHHFQNRKQFFSKIAVGENFLVGENENEILVYPDIRTDCFVAFETNSTNLTTIAIHKSEEDISYILLNYVTPFRVLIRVVETKFKSLLEDQHKNFDEDFLSEAYTKHHVFEDTIAKLRTALLKRKLTLESIKDKLTDVHGKNPNLVVSEIPLKIKVNDEIPIVKVVGQNLKRPTELKEAIENLKLMVHAFKDSIESDRVKSRVGRHTTEDLEVGILNVNNLIYDGQLFDGIEFSPNGKTLSINLPVTAEYLNTDSLILPTSEDNSNNVEHISGNITVESLHVEEINGIPWDRFYGELFLKDRDKSIHGNLTFRQSVIINSANEIEHINDISVKDGFNLVHPQNISSNLFIPSFFLTKLETESLNGLNFVNDVALIGKDNFIDSHVIIEKMSIEGNLILADDDHKARHVFGTSFEDFQQIYSGRVVINGSLTVNNIHLKSANVYLNNNQLIDLDFSKNYWMKSIDQTFTNPVIFENSIINCSHLQANSINDHPVDQYLLASTNEIKDPTQLVFMSANVEGSVYTDPKFPTKLGQLSSNAIRYGETAEIFGHKTFTTMVEIDHLVTDSINELPIADLVHNSMEIVEITGEKSFEFLEVKNLVDIKKNLQIKMLNNRTNVQDLFNHDYHFDNIISNKLNINDIVFDYLNGYDIQKILKYVEFSGNEIILHKDVNIEGNAIFENNVQVDYINGLLWNDYRNKLALLNEDNLKISGQKTFQNSLEVMENFTVNVINGYNVSDIFENILLESHPQTITGNWTFNNVHFEDLSVDVIDNIHCSNLIDLNEENVIINSSIVAQSLKSGSDLNGGFKFDFKKIEKDIREIDQSDWEEIWVLGKAEWPTKYGNETILDYLYHNAVRIDIDQNITGKVVIAHSALIGSMIEHNSIFPKLKHIADDCLYRHSSDEQVITGLKRINRPLHIGTMVTRSLLKYPFINDIDIVAFNSSLYRINEPSLITSKKYFQKPLIIENLIVDGNINGVEIDQLYFAGKSYNTTPHMVFSNLITKNLNIGKVNDVDLDLWLKNRVRKHGEAQEIFGFLTFDNLILSKNITMQSINGIRIDNLLFKSSNHLQEVYGTKTVKELTLIGPTVVVKLNNVDVIDKYRRTIFLNQNYKFKRITMESAVFENGLVVRNLLNGYPVDLFLNGYNTLYKKLLSNLEKIKESWKVIENIYGNYSKTNRLLYLEYDINSIIRWNKSISTGIQSEIVKPTEDECKYQKFIVKYAPHVNRISISRQISNTITQSLYGCNATVTNICTEDRHYSELSVCGIKLVFESVISSLHTFYNKLDRNYQYVLVQIKNRLTLFRFELGKKYFENKLTINGNFYKIKLLSIQSVKFLLTNLYINNKPLLLIYKFDDYQEIFTEIQSFEGDFNIFDMIAIDSNCYHLLLSCKNCGKLLIFEYDRETNLFILYQNINVKASVYELIHLENTDEKYFVLITKFDNDLYHLYKYNYIQGWEHVTFGYFNGIEILHPLVNSLGVTDSLLIIGKNKNTAIKLFTQEG